MPTIRKRPGPEQQKRTIEQAAIRLMAEHGTRAVSISQICKQAQVSRDTYYRCFPDKESLLRHLYQTAINDHIEAVLSAWNLDYRDKRWLHSVFDQTIDAILENHEVARFLYMEAADPNSPAHHVIDQAYRKVVRRMQRWCRETYGRAPTREYLYALLMACQWLVQDAIRQGMGKAAVKRAKQASEQLFFAALTHLPD